jgi:putative FmdB family regulatory protein
MPIYEYGCSECGHRLEEQQKMADPPLVTCPACGKDRLEKLISATSFMLKGSGWYKDGYGNQNPDKKPRTEAQVNDRLTRAIDEDKKKTAAKEAAAAAPAATASTDSSSSSSTASASSTSAAASTTTTTKSSSG